MKPINVLLTGCGGLFIKDTIDCLLHNGERTINIFGVASRLDMRYESVLSGYAQVKNSDEPGYLEQILQICEQNKIDIVLPTVESELELFSSHKDLFRKAGAKVSVSNHASISQTDDKANFLKTCRKSGVPHPRSLVAEDRASMISAVEFLGYPRLPVCIKLCGQEGSRGFRIIVPEERMGDLFLHEKPTGRYTTLSSMEAVFSTIGYPKLIVQEYVSGTEYSTDSLCDNGAVLCMTGRMNYLLDNSIPMSSRITKNEIAFDYTRRIVAAASLDGNVGIDFFIRDDGGVVAIECNPRLTATVGLSRYAGINLVYLQVKRLLEEEFNAPLSFEEITMERKTVTTFFDKEGDIIG